MSFWSLSPIWCPDVWDGMKHLVIADLELVLTWDYTTREELFSFLLAPSSLLKGTEHLSLSATTVYVSRRHGNNHLTRAMNLTLVWYTCVSLHNSCISLTPSLHSPPALLFAATSSTRLEDLNYLDNQRAAGHRSSVRKHNTAGRTNDDSKGILWLNPRGWNVVCKYSLAQLQACVGHVCTSPKSQLKLHEVSHSHTGLTLSSHFIQGDWCHSNKPTSC